MKIVKSLVSSIAYGATISGSEPPQPAISNACYYPTLPSMPNTQLCQMTSISMAPSPSAATVTYHANVTNPSTDSGLENQYLATNLAYTHNLPPLDIYGKIGNS